MALVMDAGGRRTPWALNSARYWIEREASGERRYVLIVAARCRLGTLDVDDLALVDTGAHWSVIGGDLAELVSADLGPLGEPVKMSTRLGTINGHLRRLTITLVADNGSDLQVSGTVLVAPEWTGPTVLGYRGFFERVRIALDPGTEVDDQMMYFGAVE
jgi:hypothetical protein